MTPISMNLQKAQKQVDEVWEEDWENIKNEYSQSGLFDSVVEKEIDKDMVSLMDAALHQQAHKSRQDTITLILAYLETHRSKTTQEHISFIQSLILRK